MVSKSNTIETNTICSCGNGDTTKAQKNYFENKCPNCGSEGTLQLETQNNTELSNNSDNSTDSSSTTNNDENKSPSQKIVCKKCGSEFCGQDGYDMLGGIRSNLNSVNPNEIKDDGEESEPSSQEENETTYMSGWEGLCDLLKPLDGQAMIVQRGDFVVVKKIEMPQSAELWAYEGINVVDDSVTITDYTPEIYNTFIIKWGEQFENELEFTFDKHKKLFGERKIVIEAKKVQVVEDESKKNDDDKKNEDDKNQEEDDKNKTNGSLTNSLFTSNNQEELKNKYSSIDTTGDLGSLDETGATGQEQEAPQTEEVPITTKEEAKQFGMTEVGKAKREDGHTVELKVIGNSKFQVGEWCHVRLPSFNEDNYMFISKCSFESSTDNEYINSLTLVDYPPSLGKTKKNEQNSEENSDDTTGTDGTSTDENSDNNNNSDSNNNSKNNSNSNDSSSGGNSTSN